jgi:hypothetical protein
MGYGFERSQTLPRIDLQKVFGSLTLVII